MNDCLFYITLLPLMQSTVVLVFEGQAYHNLATYVADFCEFSHMTLYFYIKSYFVLINLLSFQFLLLSSCIFSVIPMMMIMMSANI